LIQHHAQRIDIRARIDIDQRPGHLLRAAVGRRAHEAAQARVRRVGRQHARQRFGHAEVDDLDRGRLVLRTADQHVAGLEIAVDQSFLMRVQHAFAGLKKQRDACADIQFQLIAMRGDIQTAHVLHRKIRLSRRGGAGFIDHRHVGMVHQRQRLPLGLETRKHLLAVHAGLDQLQCDLALHRFALFGQVHRTHAALTERIEQLIGADGLPDHR
jgi:hypothetical protein